MPVAPAELPTDDAYAAARAAVEGHFARVTAGERVHLFTTDAPPLFLPFLEALPADVRQQYACSACRRFFDRYGGLVRVGHDGQTTPAMWPTHDVPEPFAGAMRVVAAAVADARITGVFLTTEPAWGRPLVGGWDHFSVTASSACLCKPSLLRTAPQLAAERRADHETLSRGLDEFPLELVRNAHALLTSGTLFRSEKCIEVACWLKELHERREAARNARWRENLTWLAVAGAPPGFCHVRSTMIGTLLSDLAAKLPFPTIKARFDAKMSPLQYQRPTAAPTAGNIAEAEKIVETLRAAGALERRFAKLSDLRPLWMPPPPAPEPERKGVFSHLLARADASSSQIEAPPVTITWEKFARTVLPTAARIEYLVPATKQSYLAFVTAKNADAPPIVQWDFEDARNPVTLYVYVNGSPPEQWNLRPGAHHPVTAVTRQPSAWSDRASFVHQGNQVVFVLAGAKDTTYVRGAGFFPEFLKSELRPIRATMEAYAKNAVVEGKDEAEACGICLSKGGTWNLSFRVTATDGMRSSYVLDRWD